MGRANNEAAQVRRLLSGTFGHINQYYAVHYVEGEHPDSWLWTGAEAVLTLYPTLPGLSYCPLRPTNVSLARMLADIARYRWVGTGVERGLQALAIELEAGRDPQTDGSALWAEAEAAFEELDLPFSMLMYATGHDGQRCVGFWYPRYVSRHGAFRQFKRRAAAMRRGR